MEKGLRIKASYIDVEPDAVLLTDVGDGLDGIKGSIDGSAGRAVNKEGQVTLTSVTNNQLLQFGGNHATPATKKKTSANKGT